MAWLKSNWRWVALNLCGISILTLVLSQGSTYWDATDAFDPGLESGKWAIRFLLICLAITPLNTYFGWHSLISLRKPAGLWAFGFALLHLLVYIKEAGWAWLTWPFQPFIALGLLGLLILTALALTSNRWAMRRLRKNWKRLHRLVYPAAIAAVLHFLLAVKLDVRKPVLYIVILAVLLGARLVWARQRSRMPQRAARERQRPLTATEQGG